MPSSCASRGGDQFRLHVDSYIQNRRFTPRFSLEPDTRLDLVVVVCRALDSNWKYEGEKIAVRHPTSAAIGLRTLSLEIRSKEHPSVRDGGIWSRSNGECRVGLRFCL